MVIESSTNLILWVPYRAIPPQNSPSLLNIPVEESGQRFFRIAP
jgi:hypothetical protein